MGLKALLQVRPHVRHILSDGRMLQERVDTAKGSAKNPMSTEEVIRKYEILAGKVLPPKRVTELKETVFHLERLGDIRELARMLML